MSKHLEADSCAQAQELCGISAKARRWDSGYQRALTQTVRGLQGTLKTTYSKAVGPSDKASFTDPSKNHSSALLAPGPKLWGQLSIRVPDWTHGPYVQGFSHYCLRESGQQGRSQARTTPKVLTHNKRKRLPGAREQPLCQASYGDGCHRSHLQEWPPVASMHGVTSH